ncbi:MAG: hypothetical protein D4S01_09055 [Dehalococcoidia bacterium]|nr:MAG: hypothetical protein D4S01_09055 [Dehalococcoidia bacterium]
MPSFRHSFFYTGLNCVFKCDEFKQNGLPYEVKRTEHKTAIPRAEPVKKKKSIFQKIKDLYRFFCPQVEKHILERNLRQSRKEYFESLNPESANNHENLDVNDSEDLDFNDSEDFNSFEDFSDSEDLDSLIPFADNDEDLDESLFS